MCVICYICIVAQTAQPPPPPGDALTNCKSSYKSQFAASCTSNSSNICLCVRVSVTECGV